MDRHVAYDVWYYTLVANMTLCKVVSAIAAGHVPPAARPYSAGGRLRGLLKPNGGTRPIAIGESLRGLIGWVMVLQKIDSTEQHFAPAPACEPGAPIPPGAEPARLGVGTGN